MDTDTMTEYTEAERRDIHSALSRMQSHVHDTSVLSSETLVLLKAHIDKSNERYSDGKLDHAAIWDKVNEHSAFQNNWKGFVAGVTFVAAGAGALLVLVYEYLRGPH